jgi:hypothetical protein
MYFDGKADPMSRFLPTAYNPGVFKWPMAYPA